MTSEHDELRAADLVEVLHLEIVLAELARDRAAHLVVADAFLGLRRAGRSTAAPAHLVARHRCSIISDELPQLLGSSARRDSRTSIEWDLSQRA